MSASEFSDTFTIVSTLSKWITLHWMILHQEDMENPIWMILHQEYLQKFHFKYSIKQRELSPYAKRIVAQFVCISNLWQVFKYSNKATRYMSLNSTIKTCLSTETHLELPTIPEVFIPMAKSLTQNRIKLVIIFPLVNSWKSTPECRPIHTF